MDASAQPLARLRGIAFSTQALRRLTLLNAVMLILIVATGATVRLTGSGLGCEHWPGCQQHHFEPKSFHSYIEFSNRVVAFFTILATLVTFGAAVWARLSTRLRVLAFVIFFGTLLRVPLRVRNGSLVVAAAAFVLIVSGTLATAAGPHPGSTVVRRLWSFEPAVYWHVRATAVFGVSFAALLVWLVRNRSPHLRAAL